MKDHVPNFTERLIMLTCLLSKGTQEIHKNQPRVILAGLINITHTNPTFQLYKAFSTLPCAPVDLQPSLFTLYEAVI